MKEALWVMVFIHSNRVKTDPKRDLRIKMVEGSKKLMGNTCNKRGHTLGCTTMSDLQPRSSLLPSAL